MRSVFTRAVLLGFILLISTGTTQAASLYIDPPKSELNRGDAVALSVRLDVDEDAEECINAVDAVLTYTSNIAPVDISLGDSIFSMWVQEPVINKEEKTISFAGGMPNGYCGRVTGDPRLTNNLVTLIFRAPGFTIGSGSDSPVASVEFTEFTTAYLNDGFGTKISPRTFGAEMILSKTPGGTVNPWKEEVSRDVIPPEDFSIFLQKGELEFSGKYYISFNTTDKQTGVDLYQVMEESAEQFGTFMWGRADAPWITTRSPYVLDDQSLNSVIRVRAVDKAGNEYISTLLPEESMRTVSKNQMTTLAISGLILLIVIGCLGIISAYVVQIVRRKKTLESTDNEGSDDEDGDLLESKEYDE